MATGQNLSKEKRADADAAYGYFTAHANRMTYASDEFQQQLLNPARLKA